MKSVRPQGQGFSQGSQRSGGQTRSEAICLTPSRLHLLQARKRVTAQSWQQPFVFVVLLCRALSILLERRWKLAKVPKKLVLGSEKLWAVDSNAAVTSSGSIKNLLAEGVYTRPRFGLIAIAVFAGMGLALVLIGIFSVRAHTVALQTHDIGVRMALGAQQGKVLKMVLWKGLRLISVGVLLGVLASLALTHFLTSQIQGVSARDPLTFLAVVILFLAVGMIASLLPARRAAGIDLLSALRYE